MNKKYSAELKEFQKRQDCEKCYFWTKNIPAGHPGCTFPGSIDLTSNGVCISKRKGN